MRFVTRLLPAVALPALLMSGCVTQQTNVMEQSQQASLAGGVPAPAPRLPPHRVPPAQCLPPRGSGPFTPPPKMTNVVHYEKPARAAAEHIAGCASVRFRVGPDGVPLDIEVLADYPPGLGIAQSLITATGEARFVPTNDLSWHFHSVTFRRDQ